jgi:hypothetical protein
MDVFDDPNALLPQDLDQAQSRKYEERIVRFLHEHMMSANAGLVEMDAIELVGSRPETMVVFRYHHRPAYIGQDPAVVSGSRAEAAKLWEFAIDDESYSGGMMNTPPVVATEIGSAFDAAELPLIDPDTLTPIGSPPKVFPRLLSEANAELMRRKFEAWRSAQDQGR